MKKIVLLLALILSTICLTSCFEDIDHFPTKESGYWTYYAFKDGKTCHIMGLTEEGKKQNVLILPTEIEGLIVEGIGKTYAYQNSPEIIFDTVEKLYLHSEIYGVYTDVKCGTQNLEVFIPHNGSSYNFYVSFKTSVSNKFYFCDYMFENYVTSDTCTVSNLEYFVYDIHFPETGICFFTDNVISGKIEIIPPTPHRDGYIFEGWYFGEEKWDFENNLVENYFDENGKLKLMAKWIEIKES